MSYRYQQHPQNHHAKRIKDFMPKRDDDVHGYAKRRAQEKQSSVMQSETVTVLLLNIYANMIQRRSYL